MAESWEEVWRDQPAGPPLDIRLLRRRTWQLHGATRAEILASVAAVVLFIAVIAWRFAATWHRLPAVGLAAALAWVVVSLIWFRGSLRTPAPPGATGLEHYRAELERRRDHLRNPWIWHGPLVAACITLAAVLDSFAMRNLVTVAPLLAVLAAWTVFGTVRRRRQANALQREIDDLPR